METNPLICFANQWTIFHMMGASAVKELWFGFHFQFRKTVIVFFS